MDMNFKGKITFEDFRKSIVPLNKIEKVPETLF